ncbi:hypothetical protein D9613_008386 [Agrocybe pediades]|uniref:Tat pathway signal sequence domain protein n=1 Tax=Agrocybe pediades TaxID=84607 RepID=A0A8H4VQE8_9AGAR|nr:hypothetical protein D9613_008386 [Agrocybe pediades]
MRSSTIRTAAQAGVDVHWLDGSAPGTLPTGTAFGIPWQQGVVDRTTPFSATGKAGGVPMQTWPMAYWPDGSLKWTGHAISADSLTAIGSGLTVAQGTPTEPSSPVKVATASDGSIIMSTGDFSATFAAAGGTTIVSSISLSGSKLAQNGQLVVRLQNAPDPDFSSALSDITNGEVVQPPIVQTMLGRVDSIVAEQSGPVRGVVKVTGKYTSGSSGGHADFLPFTVRFYLAAGATALRTVHFFIFDGDQQKDFIKGLGFQFSTPMTDLLHDRHVRFLNTVPVPTQTPAPPSEPAIPGLWGEPIRVVSGLRRDATAAVLDPQFNGLPTPDVSTWPTTVSSELDMLAVWSDYSLEQLSSEHFQIYKRTDKGNAVSFLRATGSGSGKRAAGLGYIGGARGGGVVFAMKDFWQGAPRSLDIRGAGTDTATTTLWAYSPKAPAMDMRHYDTVGHGLDLAYEDVGNPDPNPIGVGRSYEFSLQLFSATPSRATLAQLAVVHTEIPQLICTPEFYASQKIFGGRWNVPDTTTTGAAALEKRKSDLLDFYVAEPDQRQFYGFWNYGDIMHTYDQTRHNWRYDVGGYAWDNGELSSDLWLWMSFLRTGRADVFRMAHAMTRHLSEVDFHHIGPFAGLGSRHNVSHWGDGAKEARVAGSTLKRPFYYLTTDELVGDLMDYSLQADQTIMTWDPLRKVLPPPPPQGPGRLRIGPDWTTLAGNWFTKWERTNDTTWRDRIKTGMSDIGGFKYGLFTGNGTAVGWNADTAHLVDEGGEGAGSYSLVMIFGGGELLMEAMDLITDEPAFDAAWLDFCRLYNGSDADKIARYGKTFGSKDFPQYYAKLQAYAGQRLNDTSLKQAAWDIINKNTVGVWAPVQTIGGTDVLNQIREIPNLGTNDAGQLSLSEYAVLAIAPELAPNSLTSEGRPSWDEASTTDVGNDPEWDENEKADAPRGRRKMSLPWKSMLCFK